MTSSIYFHPSIVKITSIFFLSLKKGIENHYLEKDLLPYLLGHIYEPSDYERKITWLNINDIVYGLTCPTIY